MKDLAQRLSALSADQRAVLLTEVGARLVEQQRPTNRIPRRSAPDTRVHLSHLQEQLWFLERLAPGQATYHVPTVFRLTGALDLAALRWALTEIVNRHETLRTTYTAEDGQPYQVIAEPSENPDHLVVEDLTNVADSGEREAEAARRIADEVRRPFDLVLGPLLRLLLLRLADDTHVLAMTTHHIGSDGWSTAVLTGELAELYTARVTGRDPQLAPLGLQYSDYAIWQRKHLRGGAFDAQLDYWERQLDGVPVLELPTDRSRPASLSHRSATVSRILPEDLLADLRALSAAHGVTLFMTLMTAYKALLARYTGQDEIVVGTTTTGRDPRELEPLIGYFVNMVVLRTDSSGDPSFAELLKRLRVVVLEAWRHQDVPFEKVVERICPARNTARNPLFQVGLQLLGSATRETEPTLPGLDVRTVEVDTGGHPFDLSVTATEGPHELRLLAEYSTDLFDQSRITRLLDHLERVLRAAVADPTTALSKLPLLSQDEREQVLVRWQGPAGDQARTPVHVQIAEVAAHHPDLIAAKFGDTELSYAELDRRAGVLARQLRALGVGREDIVALLLGRGFDVLVAMLATHKAGGAFVVMDPDHPRRRLEFILADTAAKAVVTSSDLVERLPAPDGWTPVCVDTNWDDLEASARAAADQPWPELADQNSLAYVLYTSGSTGNPKGVLVEHHALNTFLLWMGGVFDLGPGDRLLQHMSLVFDFAEGEIFTALTRGVTMVLVPEAHRADPEGLGRLLAAERITYLGGPPAVLGRIPQAAYPDLKYMIAGGEAVTGSLINRWNTPGRRFVNGYGPTEAAVGCIFYECEHRTWTGQPPIGRAMPNRLAYVLDRWHNPQPVGVPGEVVVGGDGLARGYLNQPELTAAKFFENPFLPGTRLYRTGDLGVWTEDGQIQFLGRIDTQVKLNGLRIELEEIEATLLAHSDVADAAVVLTVDGPGIQRLVGYVVPAGEAAPMPEALRAHLLDDLPAYMVPHMFVALDALPLSSVGKVDRATLAASGAQGGGGAAFVAPRTPVEEQLAAIFAEVLGAERVSIEDNFFELGGNSLQAARVISRIVGAASVELSMRDFYATPKVRDLARIVANAAERPAAAQAGSGREDQLRDEIEDLERRLAEARSALSSSGEANCDEPHSSAPASEHGAQLRRSPGAAFRAPLSFSQEQLWFLDQLASQHAAYNLPVPLRLTGPLDASLLGRALTAVVERHEPLRTSFATDGAVPYQSIAPAAEVALPIEDLSSIPATEREAAMQAAIEADASAPFDLSRSLMLRARLIRIAPREHVLSLVMHHICADGWSVGVLVRDIAELYDALREGRVPALPALPIQYAEHAVNQRELFASGALEADLDYWARQLADVPTLDLPTDRPRPAELSYRGALLVYRMPADILEGLHAVARTAGTSTYAVLLAGFKAVLARYTGVDDVVVGTAGSGRSQPEVEELIGFLVNTMALRTDLSGDPTFVEAARRTMETLLAAWDHQEAPFEKVVERVALRRDPNRNPLFQVYLDLLADSPLDFRVPDLKAEFVEVDTQGCPFDMSINAYQEIDGITFRIEYATDLFDHPRIERLFQHLETLLRAGSANPGRRLSELPLLSQRDREWLLTAGRGADRDYDHRPVHALFADTAARHPDAAAVVAGEERCTYRELAARTARFAAHLRSRGVRHGDIVPVLLDRGLDGIVALLGVLRAGASYAPLDTRAPVRRLSFIVADTAAPLLVTSPEMAAGLGDALGIPVAHPDARGLDDAPGPLDAGWQEWARDDSLAFVLYTSGSTGEPKGVLIEHSMLTHHLAWMVSDLDIRPGDRMLHCCAPTFDMAIGEVLSALTSGATVVVASRDGVFTPGGLGDVMRREQVTHVFTTPTLMRLVDPAPYPDLRSFTVAGEVAPPDLINTWNTPGRQIVNMYGPAETTIGCTWYECPDEEFTAPPPIGGVMPNRRVYILDGTGDLAPIGVFGEIVVGGTGVAAGYLNRPELTGERFIADPFAPSGRAYRTGDLGRWTGDGQIEFLGRRDGQVKIRGLRIEIGEIEHTLLAHPDVVQAAVTIQPDQTGESRLVAYVVPGGARLDAADLRHHVAAALPAYMVPSGWQTVDALPYGVTGKVDRKALAGLRGTVAQSGTDYVAPRTKTEKRIAAVFAEILDAERVGVDDEFFALGGTSLQAIRAVARLAEFVSAELSIRDIYATPTVAVLAELVSRRTGASEADADDWELLAEVEAMTEEDVERLLAAQ